MLIVLAGGAGRSLIVKHLIDNHRFMGRTTLPRSAPSPGARVVVMSDLPKSFRDRITTARRVRKLGGLLVWLDQYVPGIEATLPDPVSTGSMKDVQKRMVEAFEEVDGLVALLGRAERG